MSGRLPSLLIAVLALRSRSRANGRVPRPAGTRHARGRALHPYRRPARGRTGRAQPAHRTPPLHGDLRSRRGDRALRADHPQRRRWPRPAGAQSDRHLLGRLRGDDHATRRLDDDHAREDRPGRTAVHRPGMGAGRRGGPPGTCRRERALRHRHAAARHRRAVGRDGHAQRSRFHDDRARRARPFRARWTARARCWASRASASTMQVTVERVQGLDFAALGKSFASRSLGTLSPPDSVRASVGGTALSVRYSRPSMRGRVIFGNVVPWNRVVADRREPSGRYSRRAPT